MKTIPYPYRDKTLPPNYVSVSVDEILRKHIPELGQMILSAWTHGKHITILHPYDPVKVRNVLTQIFDDYPFQGGISKEGNLVVQWMDPDAPGSSYYHIFDTAHVE